MGVGELLKAVIFDMDGVIIDSEPLHFSVDQDIMKSYGISIEREDLEPFVGTTNPEMWTKLKETYKLCASVNDILSKQIREKINRLSSSGLAPIDGITALLEMLQGRGVRIGLASSSPRRFIEAVLDSFGISSYFTSVVSGEEVVHGKPAPDVFLRAAEELGVHPQQCLVIEDSMHGIQAAKSAGMICIGYINPNSGQLDLSKADCTVDTIRDIDWSLIERLSSIK
jgi:beta-phosphoglucomutase family hydrolase